MYAAHFGLVTEPFGSEPSPGAPYLSASAEEALAAVTCGLLDRRGVITLTGEAGLGKSTLARHAAAAAKASGVDPVFVTYMGERLSELILAVLGEASIRGAVTSDGELHAELRRFLLEQQNKGRSTALIIDDAHRLPRDLCQELALLTKRDGDLVCRGLQILLIGLPTLDRLTADALGDLVGVRAHLTRFDDHEMQDYIAHRLAQVNATTSLFPRRTLRLLIRNAEGSPRRANLLSHTSLLFAYGNEEAQVTPATVRDAIDRLSCKPVGVRGQRWGVALFAALAATIPVVLHLASPQALTTQPYAVPLPGIGHTGVGADDRMQTRVRLVARDLPAPTTASIATTGAPPPRGRSATRPHATSQKDGSRSPATPEAIYRVVPPGSWLLQLARDAYGTTEFSPHALLKAIRKLNPEIQDLNRLEVGTTIVLPPVPPPPSGIRPQS